MALRPSGIERTHENVILDAEASGGGSGLDKGVLVLRERNVDFENTFGTAAASIEPQTPGSVGGGDAA
jgi:hypothetical protein